jgi:hypothetical protein
MELIVLVTVTSVDAFNEPEPTVVSPTLRVMFPAVPVNPPNFALNAVTVTLLGSVVVKVILVAGFEEEPTCEYVGCCVKLGLLVTVVIVQVSPLESVPVTDVPVIFVPLEPKAIVPVWPQAFPHTSRRATASRDFSKVFFIV